ncbi:MULTISPECIES: hypothetical protein [Bacillus cereus group]|uniref:Uncharacterized protein n=2 Tax=Bacillus cereus group TaxID=86661 RepID=A0A9X6UP46_BACCE|nr:MULTISPECIES: hypothetical protein [Bacillus cereus group]MCC6081790.1 hypothetical protein [Bacillus thuringiensis]MEE3960606.1 hypothetical protein [Bacillus thuringiensis]PEB86970.1 hypothetical protein COM94_12185 [Bacillus thuringiensis]PEQ54429.1 hypothetical protein CN473_08125 [Bacillus thuringiensis]PEQ89980.1 hypothetical protein CN475_07455 [Bacillus cereus]
MLLLRMILNILLGDPHERQFKIRENIQLLSEQPAFNDLIECYGRSFLLTFRIQRFIGNHDARLLIHNPAKLQHFCEELECMIRKRSYFI